jgi:hypothetical protein
LNGNVVGLSARYSSKAALIPFSIDSFANVLSVSKSSFSL